MQVTENNLFVSKKEWLKLEDLIKEVEPDFAFSASGTYRISNAGVGEIRVCSYPTKPSSVNSGVLIGKCEHGMYKPDAGFLWIYAEA